MNRPEDCPDESGNGHGCMPLTVQTDEIRAEQHRHDLRISSLERRFGQMQVTIDFVKDSVERIESRQDTTAKSVDAIRATICAPANEALVQYQSDHSELLDADDGDNPVPTSVSIRVPHLAERRIRKEQQRSTKAVKQRNWMATGMAIGGVIVGILEALRLAGVIK